MIQCPSASRQMPGIPLTTSVTGPAGSDRPPLDAAHCRAHLPPPHRGTPLASPKRMRISNVPVRLLVALLVLLLLHSAAQGQIARPAQVYQMAGTCSTEVRPDAAVIVGGVVAGGGPPVEAVRQPENQLAPLAGHRA